MKRFLLGSALASVLVLASCDQAGSDEAALQTEAAVAAAVAEVSADYEARIAALMAEGDRPTITDTKVEPAIETSPASGNYQKEDLDTLSKKLSYIVGENTGLQFKSDGIELDVEALGAGVANAVSGRDSLLNEEEKRQVITEIQTQARERQEAEYAAKATANKTEGQAFLVDNANRDGVVTTESGLQYEVVKAGNGPKPTENDRVTVHYKGTLIDGTVFDSSYERGQPATFPVGGVIPGWIEGLQLMSVGAKYEFAIPSELAYGAGGTGPIIGPNATLLFEVELLAIE